MQYLHIANLCLCSNEQMTGKLEGTMGKPILYLKIFINLIVFLMVCLFFIFIFPKLLWFFLPFVIGWIISIIANPLVKFLEKKVKIVRKHSSAIFIIVVIAAIVALGYFVIAFLCKEIISLSNDWDNLVQNFSAQLNEVSNRMNSFTKSMPFDMTKATTKISETITSYLDGLSEGFKLPSIESAGNLVNNIADIFLQVIVTILSAYFFIAQRNELVAGLKRIVPKSLQTNYQLVSSKFKSAFGGYFKAQLKIMCVITVIIFIGFEILNVSYSFLLAFLIAFLDFLPFFGTGAVLWPWAIIEFITGEYFKGIALLVIYLICQIVKQMLQPKMVGDSIGISPLATLVFMFVGYRFGGVLGMIFGIPIGMVLVSFYQNGMFDGIINGMKIAIQDLNDFRKLK